MTSPTSPDTPTIVVIDDDQPTRHAIAQMLRLRHHAVHTFSSAEAALAWPPLLDAHCILTDIKMPGIDGEQLLATIATHPQAHPPIIMITGHGDIAMAVRCLKAGAYDFVEKPFDDALLLAAIARAIDHTTLQRHCDTLRRQVDTLAPLDNGRHAMVGRSQPMADLYDKIDTVAPADAPVLILGETGSGKELVARAIHAHSPRAQGPFVPVNAAALPETTLESELFGHTRGAFTGADTDRDGKLITASGGTLLLDEIENISSRAQIQLLRVIEDGLVVPLGTDQPRHADVRILGTTKVDLQEHVRQGRMRADFYHRVAVLTVAVPSLRQRLDDIPLLVAHFLSEAATRNGTPVPQVPPNTLTQLTRYHWPGNVRELKNTVERMVITASQGTVGPFTPDDPAATPDTPGRHLSLPATGGRLRDAMEHTERTIIEATLRDHGGEVGATAHALGISRRALYERMRKYDLQKDNFRQD